MLDEFKLRCNYSVADPNDCCNATRALRAKLDPYFKTLNVELEDIAAKTGTERKRCFKSV